VAQVLEPISVAATLMTAHGIVANLHSVVGLKAAYTPANGMARPCSAA
jgi:hypothetical protein